MVKKKESFIKRISKKYKLSVTDRVTFLEVYAANVSKLKIGFLVLSIFLLGASLVVLSFFYTPARNLVPGYPSPLMRKHILENAIMVDSLYHEITMRDNYL